ncbi:hypothetical protein Vadar_009111 [Vaccinium darrowii]|uniref:Uncharacterized protein n=1 Tax=Vaccinium darrowii TaxID=229202 RepID=A0ACB7XHF3_9ERIC|nr:hypothetical protein Vadar_009111 [Vaccinium darrowii]
MPRNFVQITIWMPTLFSRLPLSIEEESLTLSIIRSARRWSVVSPSVCPNGHDDQPGFTVNRAITIAILVMATIKPTTGRLRLHLVPDIVNSHWVFFNLRGLIDVASGSQPGKEVSFKPSSSSAKNARDTEVGEKRVPSAASTFVLLCLFDTTLSAVHSCHSWTHEEIDPNNIRIALNMAFTKDQARRRETETSNRNEAELEQPPQKRRRQSHGYNLFVKDVSFGLTLGLGKKTYASYASKGALMFWAKHWYEDKKPNWKKIYAERAMEERVEPPPLPEKLKTKTKSVQSSIRTRCSPKQLVELNAKLSEGKRDALIKRNPFQTLLSLSCPYLHREFVMELVERFNPKNRTLEFRNGLRCRVTEEDFARVLGFPIGHIVVPTECEDIHRDKVEEDFPNLENAYKAINLSHLKAMIEKKNVNDDVFQRAYMLFALGCLLCPTTKDVVGSRLFPGVYGDDNMEMMKAYKWPAFMLD